MGAVLGAGTVTGTDFAPVEEGEEELQMVAAWWKGEKRRKRSSSVKEGREV